MDEAWKVPQTPWLYAYCWVACDKGYTIVTLQMVQTAKTLRWISFKGHNVAARVGWSDWNRNTITWKYKWKLDLMDGPERESKVKCSQYARSEYVPSVPHVICSPSLQDKWVNFWQKFQVRHDDRNLSSTGLISSLRPVSLIREWIVSMGFPRQFYQQPQFIATVCSPKEGCLQSLSLYFLSGRPKC